MKGVRMKRHEYVRVKYNIDINEIKEESELEKMSFENNTFDYIVGIGALHHLNLELAGKEIYRVLKNEGKAIFLEPRIPFKWIMVLRSIIPVRCNESPGGSSLNDNDIYKLEKYFTYSKIHYFLFLRKFFRIPILRRFELKSDRIDWYLINKFPVFRKFCWAFVLEFTK